MRASLPLVLLFSIVFASGCLHDGSAQSQIDDNVTTEVSLPERIESGANESAEVKQDEDARYFEPSLTYAGAYNGPLFDTSAQVGERAPLDKFISGMKRNGVSSVLMFFAIDAEDLCGSQPCDYDLESDEGIGYMKMALEKHPSRIVPFFQKGKGAEDTDPGEELADEYGQTIGYVKDSLGENVLRGLGELEEYAWDVKPNDDDMIALFDVAEENDLMVMFHPVSGQTAQVAEVLEMYPDTTFIIHQYPEDFDDDRDEWLDLMGRYGNFYFGIEADHMMFDGNIGFLYKYEDDPTNTAVQRFVSDYDRNEQSLLDAAIERYKTAIEAQPDRFFWGTEIGTEYAYDPAVYDRTIKFSRKFIQELELGAREKFAYKNAERALGSGASLN